MNIVAIILAIVVILLFYILYKFFLLKSVELTKTASLNATENPSIKIENSPTSLRYAYGIWIYVHSWDSSKAKTIYSRPNNIKLYFDKNSPILKCDITLDNDTPKTLEITDNFPIQKWTHIVISADGQYIDSYIDGKLVKSGRMYTAEPASTPKTPGDGDMNLGGGTTFDAYISKFQHWDKPVDPQTVWDTYNEGNGQGNMTNFVSSYGIDLSILKDNVEQSKYKIF
uniref:LamG-like jellyroll fold domain-containing protein n=1 Tax=viral metagenome TaxID=1070528 RepID=A0A6C0J0P9_9ZZZZ